MIFVMDIVICMYKLDNYDFSDCHFSGDELYVCPLWNYDLFDSHCDRHLCDFDYDLYVIMGFMIVNLFIVICDCHWYDHVFL
jgi:hypothetical protein